MLQSVLLVLQKDTRLGKKKDALHQGFLLHEEHLPVLPSVNTAETSFGAMDHLR